MAGTLNVDTLKADSNLRLQIASANVAFIDANGLTIVGNSLNVGGTAITSTQLSQLNANGTISAAGIASVNANTITSGTLPKARLPAGSILQVVQVEKADVFSTTSTSFVDVTGMSASITPTSASSKILVLFDIAIGAANGSSTIGKILRNLTDIYIGDAAGSRPRVAFQIDGGGGIQYTTLRVPGIYLDSPATTSSTTYKLQIYNTAGSAGTVNRTEQDRNTSAYDVRTSSSITLMEIAV